MTPLMLRISFSKFLGAMAGFCLNLLLFSLYEKEQVGVFIFMQGVSLLLFGILSAGYPKFSSRRLLEKKVLLVESIVDGCFFVTYMAVSSIAIWLIAGFYTDKNLEISLIYFSLGSIKYFELMERSRGRPLIGLMGEYLVVPLGFLVVVFLVRPDNLLVSYLSVVIFAFTLQAFIYFALGVVPFLRSPKPSFAFDRFINSGVVPFAKTAYLSLATSKIDVPMLGFFAGASVIAEYKFAFMISTLICWINSVCVSVFFVPACRLFIEGKNRQLKKLIFRWHSIQVSIGFLAAAVIAIGLNTRYFDMFFEEYTESLEELIFAVGIGALVAAVGPADSLLTITRREHELVKGYFISLVCLLLAVIFDALVFDSSYLIFIFLAMPFITISVSKFIYVSREQF